MSGAPLLEATNLDLQYGKVQVLFDVSITINQGEFVALLGTNGAGKSTFLKAVSNLSGLSGGKVVFDGQDITGWAPDRIAAVGLAHVPGGRGTLPDLTVDENLRLGGHLLKGRGKRSEFEAGIEYAYSLFDWMGGRRKQLAGTLSGGEQQMLAIARALVLRPKMLMVDELSLGLAPIVVSVLMDMLKRLNEDGLTILVVEQHATLAMETAERVLFMEKGQVRFEGRGKELAGRRDLLRSVFLGS
jgi:ABC-type branched-subunit amino acid transport system ATPase component